MFILLHEHRHGTSVYVFRSVHGLETLNRNVKKLVRPLKVEEYEKGESLEVIPYPTEIPYVDHNWETEL